MPTVAVTSKPPPAREKDPTRRNLRIFQQALYGDESATHSNGSSVLANALCLVMLLTMLFVISLTLVILGATLDIPDLFLLGGIFFAGCVVFFVMLFMTVCQPLCRRNQVEDYSKQFEKQNDITQDISEKNDRHGQVQSMAPSPEVPEAFSYDGGDGYYIDPVTPRSAHAPVRTDLYSAGSRTRSFTATPATTKDVRFYSGDDTPPPPRLKMVGEGERSKSLYSMDIPPPVFSDELKHTSPVHELELM